MVTDAGMFQVVSKMAFGVVGGLGIFLLGMKNMSEGMQAIAGARLRKMISAVTDNRLMACGVGTLVTSIVQSSSVTTVLVVGFVSASIMTLTQAIGVIMGANIGTTITGWILTLKIGKAGLPLLGVSAIVYLFSKNERIRFFGMSLMGIGMVFFGLELMSGGFKPMRQMPEFVAWFSAFDAGTYLGMWKCVLIGCILTCIVQSSSATLGITMGLALNGMIGFESAAALVLGENIGTTITAFLASLGAPTNARRAAYSHIIFNLVGVIWITSIFHPYLHVISRVLGGDPGVMVLKDGLETFPKVQGGIALVHTGFNVANTLFFLPLVGLLAKVVTRIVPEKAQKEMPHLTYLDVRLVDSGAMGIQESQDEIIKMGHHIQTMLEGLDVVLKSEAIDEEKVSKIFYGEEVLDVMQKEVTEFVTHMLSSNISADVVAQARVQLRIADEYESVSDYVAAILKLFIKMRKAGIKFSDESWEEIMELHHRICNYMAFINEGVREGGGDALSKARVQGDAITHEVKDYRDKHLTRMACKDASPLASLIFTDMLNAYRRIKDHALNLAEAVGGAK